MWYKMGLEDIVYDLLKTVRDRRVEQKERDKAAYKAINKSLESLIREWNNLRKVRPVKLYTQGKTIFKRYYDILGKIIEETDDIVGEEISNALNDLRIQLYQGTEFLEVLGGGERFMGEGDRIRDTAQKIIESKRLAEEL